MTFTFSTAGRIVFGAGVAKSLPQIVTECGARVFLVTGSHLDEDEPPAVGLGTDRRVWRVTSEPTVGSVTETLAAARDFEPDVLVAIGGGSVIDTAKSVGILLRNGGSPLDYLEIIGAGRPLHPATVPVIAVPTTAGTGAEVTANSSILSPEHRAKASLRSHAMLPAVAIVDPLLTLTCPPSVTAASGLDALTQCLEPLTSNRANPVTDALAAKGLRHAARGLRRTFETGSDVDARTDMSLCSLLGGMALANAKLGAAHGIAAVLSGRVSGAHGEICAAVLPGCTAINVRALVARDPESRALSWYKEAACILTGDPAATIDHGIAWIRETVRMLDVPALRQIGLMEADIPDVAREAMRASSMQGNPVVLTEDEITGILHASM